MLKREGRFQEGSKIQSARQWNEKGKNRFSNERLYLRVLEDGKYSKAHFPPKVLRADL